MRSLGFSPLLLAVTLSSVVTVDPGTSAVITVDDVCTLSAAIEAANEDRSIGACPGGSGADTIVLTDYVWLRAIDNDIDGPNGLPSVTSVVTIEGSGFNIIRDITKEKFRIFHVSEEGDLTLENLSVLFGRAGEPGGGGILSHGRLTLRDSHVKWSESEGNAEVARGGGIYSTGTLVMEDSLVSENVAMPSDPLFDGYVQGGGIYLNGTAVIQNSTIADNYATFSDLDQEVWASGGGLYMIATGRFEMMDSTVSGNSASGTGARGGGLSLYSLEGGSGRIVRSTISSNAVKADEMAYGGGILGAWDMMIENVTISGNEAIAQDLSFGGGFFGSRATVRHVTFSGNKAFRGAAIWTEVCSSCGTFVTSSLFASSVGDHCGGKVIDDGGGNLADDSTCLPTIADTLTGLSIVLADNGGPTATHALDSESNAIDLAGDCGLVTDQRGAARAGLCDSGSYEEIGCSLVEFKDRTVTSDKLVSACSTVLLGPNLIVDTARFWIQGPDLITIKDDVEVRTGVDFWLVNELP